MEKKQATQLITDTFNAKFAEKNFTLFIKNLLNDIEQGKKVKSYSGNYIWDDYKDHINYYKRIGKYTDPEGEPLDILIVEVKTIAKLERARASLRNFVVKHLKTFEKDYALVAFYSKENEGIDWRFSFIKLEYNSSFEKEKVKIKEDLTPAKRYSFLVGENEQSHTARTQLLPLLEDSENNPTIAEIENAFSIEKVTDKFFNQYKNLYLKISEYFKNDTIKIELEKANIDNARFTKKLLGQIVFLYFLQKKGWLGVPKNEKWGKGEKQFIQELFETAQQENANFFKDKLQYLFYEALAKERNNEHSFYEKLNCRIPFLNGGLFEAEYNWEKANITIPQHLFRSNETKEDERTGILDVFDRYNFTIKEDEPLDKEVAVDPEMLGKVFENMLEITERKSKGAFYTPREIVHYMCQESLIQYLHNALEKKVEKQDIETYIRKGHSYLENDINALKKNRNIEEGKQKATDAKIKLPESIRQNADLIDQKLIHIKICDPAIGSGAFPVGLLHELVNAQLVLKPHFSNNYLKEKEKEFGFPFHESINESRYIYRLKRHIIQESIYGVDIDAAAIDIAQLRLWLSLVIDEENIDPIETLPNLDYKIVQGDSLLSVEKNLFNNGLFEKLENLKKIFFNETVVEKKREYQKQIKEIINKLTKGNNDFDFEIYFSEVWTKNKGFDIVIGNPPYIQLQKNGGFLAKLYQNQGYKTFARSGDIYSLFYEKGINSLKEKGILSFITSNKWMRAGYGKNLRQFFSEKNPLTLLDLGPGIFENATVDTNILMLQNNKNNNRLLAKTIIDKKEIANIKETDFLNMQVTEDTWAILSKEEQNIKKKIETIGTALKDWDININYGIKTGYNEAFIIDTSKKEELIKADPKSAEIIKPILRGKDIKRYEAKFAGKWLIDSHNGVKGKYPKIEIEKYPAIKNHLDSFEPKLSKRQDKGDTVYNHRSCAYHQEFEKEKIVWTPVNSKYSFTIIAKGYYFNNSIFMITGNNVKWLCAFFNSILFRKYISFLLSSEDEYAYASKQIIEQIPIPQLSKTEQEPFVNLVETILSKKVNGETTEVEEKEIDGLVYGVYGLSAGEIEIIENT